MFSEAHQTEWREPFDFQTRISRFPIYVLMVSTPSLSIIDLKVFECNSKVQKFSVRA